MIIIDTLNKLKEVLISDLTIQDWSQAKYKKAPTLYIGDNENDAPEEMNYPVILLDEIAWEKGKNNLHGQFAASMWVGVKNYQILNEDGQEIVTTDGDRTAVTGSEFMTGLFESIEFMEVVQDALRDSEDSQGRKVFAKIDFTGGNGLITEYPWHVAYTRLTLGVIDPDNNNMR